MSEPDIASDENQYRKELILAIKQAKECLFSEESLSTKIEKSQIELSKIDEQHDLSLLFMKIQELKEEIKKIFDRITIPPLSVNPKVLDYLKDKMPKFVYYSNYGNLDSQIYLPQVLQNMQRTDLGEKDKAKARTLQTLFKFVNLDPSEITRLGAETQGNLSP